MMGISIKGLTRSMLGLAAGLVVMPPASSQHGFSPSTAGYEPQSPDEQGLWLEMERYEAQLKNSKTLIRDPAMTAYLRKVLCRTVGEARCGNTRIYLVRTPHFNASMAPNGVMMVWSGLLMRIRNEAQLASVLGHEFGHFERRHSLQGLRDMRAKSDAIAVLSVVPLLSTVGQLEMIGSVLRFNREMEREADFLSLGYLEAAGYDPLQAAQIWQQLRDEMDAVALARKERSQKDMDGGFFASHPGTKERMNYLRAYANKKPDVFVGKEEYQAAVSTIWPQLIDDQIKLNDFGATEFLLQQLAVDGWSGPLLFARAELYRQRAKKGDFEKAVDFYQQAVTQKDAPVESWRGLGVSRLRASDVKGGKEALARYVALAPDAGDVDMIRMMAQ